MAIVDNWDLYGEITLHWLMRKTFVKRVWINADTYEILSDDNVLPSKTPPQEVRLGLIHNEEVIATTIQSWYHDGFGTMTVDRKERE